MRKIITIFLSLLIALTLTACQERRTGEPNEGRGTNYTYDFIDYVDILVYGEDGSGYFEMKPKEISMADFPSEKDYINMKKDLEAFGFTYKQGIAMPSTFTVSKSSQISNGDVITISPNKKVNPVSNLNIEPFDYVVEGLGQSEEIDLFASDLVEFFALNDGTYSYMIKNNPAYSQELKDNLVYTISTRDEPIPGKAVLSVTVDLKQDFLKENGYSSLLLYLSKHKQKANLSMEKVLSEVVTPIDMATANSAGIESALYKYIGDKEPDMIKIANLQQTERQRSAEPYTYAVVYINSTPNGRQYVRRAVKMVSVDGEYLIIDSSERVITNESYTTEAFDGANMIFNYMIDNKEVPSEENKPVVEENQNTSETQAEETNQNAE